MTMSISALIATLFGIGHLRPAPGTWGALAALPLAIGLYLLSGPWGVVVATVAVGFAGLWATRVETAGSADKDPGHIVIDEVVGQWIALWPVFFGAAGASVGVLALWPGWVAGFVLFRLFDIWKPGPIGWADRRRCDGRDARRHPRGDRGGALRGGARRSVARGAGAVSVAALLDAARARGVMITTAESCTGGLVAAALTEVAGSSAVFERGFVTYSNAAKVTMLGVLPATLDAHGAVSEPVAREMAQGALARSQAQVAVAITGIAGPGASEFKPEGRVCFALATARDCRALTVEYGAIGRAQVRTASVAQALSLLSDGVGAL